MSRLRVTCAVVCIGAIVASGQIVYLRNGSFSQCVEPCDEFGSPTDWEPEGNPFPTTIGIWRDQVDYLSAPASLAVISLDTASANFNQPYRNATRLPAAPGQTFTFEADVKIDSVNGGSFQLVSHFSCGTYWVECPSGGWVTHYYGNSVTNGWVHVNHTGTVPPTATWGLVRVHISRRIGFHVDNIKINGQEEVVGVVRNELAPIADRTPRLAATGVLELGSEPCYAVEVLRPDGRAVLKTVPQGSTVRLTEKELSNGVYVIRLTTGSAIAKAANVVMDR